MSINAYLGELICTTVNNKRSFLIQVQLKAKKPEYPKGDVTWGREDTNLSMLPFSHGLSSLGTKVI